MSDFNKYNEINNRLLMVIPKFMKDVDLEITIHALEQRSLKSIFDCASAKMVRAITKREPLILIDDLANEIESLEDYSKELESQEQTFPIKFQLYKTKVNIKMVQFCEEEVRKILQALK